MPFEVEEHIGLRIVDFHKGFHLEDSRDRPEAEELPVDNQTEELPVDIQTEELPVGIQAVWDKEKVGKDSQRLVQDIRTVADILEDTEWDVACQRMAGACRKIEALH